MKNSLKGSLVIFEDVFSVLSTLSAVTSVRGHAVWRKGQRFHPGVTNGPVFKFKTTFSHKQHTGMKNATSAKIKPLNICMTTLFSLSLLLSPILEPRGGIGHFVSCIT